MKKKLKRKLSMLILLFFVMSQFHVNGTVHAATNEKTSTEGVNILDNASFETSKKVTASKWAGGVEPDKWSTWIPGGTPTLKVDNSIYHEGASSILISGTSSSRVDISQTVNVTPGKVHNFKFWLKTENVVSSLTNGGAYVRTQYFDSANKKVGDGPAIKSIKGTNDWTPCELMIPVPYNASKLRLELFLETGTGKIWYDDLKLIETSTMIVDFKLSQSMLSLNKGQTASLVPIFNPDNVPDKTIDWKSDNPLVAAVGDDGSVTGLAYGSTTIRATMKYGSGLYSAQCLVSVEPSDTSIYDNMRLKWFNKLTGNDKYNSQDLDIARGIDSVVSKVTNTDKTGFWDTMDKAAGRTYLWSNLASATKSADISSGFSNIKSMALAYSFIGSKLYHNNDLKNDIVSALDWMCANRYNENIKYYDNWWDWEIGTPQSLNDSLALMYDDLTPDIISKYIKAIDKFASDPTKAAYNGMIMTGANRLDKAIVAAMRGVIGKNSIRICQARDAVSDVFEYVTKGDGFYTDGSFIQHTNVPYVGSYGSVLINSLSNLLFVLKDTSWDVTDPNFKNVYDWIVNSYEPLFYKGAVMNMVSGRAISRESAYDHKSGRSMLLTLLRLSEGLPNNQSIDVKSFIKGQIQSDTTFTNYFENLNLNDIVNLKTLQNDTTIKPREEIFSHKIFPNMDRVVHFGQDFAFGISMSSKRIGNFEYGNGENKKGWYTGYGMNYLYNNDQTQFSDGYWATINMLRLPGTTTDGSQAPLKEWNGYLSPKNWVGGSSDGLYGATGMEFKIENSSLTGKKSWFNFDNEIVALGAGITGTDNVKVETIVENRKLNENGDNNLIVNGVDKSNKLGWEENMDNVNWAHLAGNAGNSGIGYYFPNKSSIYGLREAKTGSWNDVNKDGSTTPLTRNYLSLAFEHGNNPTNDSYCYVELPNRNDIETEEYSNNPDITILNNTKDVQAVKEMKLGLTAANFWIDGPQSAGIVSVDKKASVMVKETNGYLEISVADPTMENTGVINIELDKAAAGEMLKDPAILVTQLEPTVKLSVNVKDAKGGSIKAKFNLNK